VTGQRNEAKEPAGQFRRYLSKCNLGRDTKEGKKSENMSFEFFEKDRRRKEKY
jgi:hypothetical protein